MATKWDYLQVIAGSDSSASSSTEAKSQAANGWMALLNQRGDEGWELVTERFLAGGSGVALDYWAQYAGTMKRPRQKD